IGPGEVRMRKGIVLFLLLLAVFCWLEAAGSPQEKSNITVTSSELNNGVVILHVLQGDKTYQLECNANMPECTTHKSGSYQIIELPKGFGMYECRDVEIYASANSPDKDKKIGEYCMVEK
ncbi:MAG: hypothetical protein WBC78_17400, partial [Candidatus Sulfotelmatobacter sp.]